MTDCTSEECRRALADLHDFLRRETSDEVASGIEAHLARCKPCLAHADFEKQFLDAVATACAGVKCPAELRRRICARLGLADHTAP